MPNKEQRHAFKQQDSSQRDVLGDTRLKTITFILNAHSLPLRASNREQIESLQIRRFTTQIINKRSFRHYVRPTISSFLYTEYY